METEINTKQLPSLIKEWMQTEEELKALSAEAREKKKRLGLVRSMIMSIMKQSQIGTLKISSGAVITRPKKTKGALTKKFIIEALTDFFKGDIEKAKECAAYLDTQRPIKTTESLSLEPN